MIHNHLNKDEFVVVPDSSEEHGIEDRHEIEETDEIVETVRHGKEKELIFRDLEKEGDRQEKCEDNDPTEHQPFHGFDRFLMIFF